MVTTAASLTPLSSKIFVSASAPTIAKCPFSIFGSLVFCVFQNERKLMNGKGLNRICLIIQYSGSNESAPQRAKPYLIPFEKKKLFFPTFYSRNKSKGGGHNNY